MTNLSKMAGMPNDPKRKAMLAQVQIAPDPLSILTVNLSDVMELPDADAAVALHNRALLYARVERIYTQGFTEVGIIAREVEQRHLYQYLTDPNTGEPFSCFSAWAESVRAIACRRTIFAAKRVIAKLEDVPKDKLIGIPSSNLYTLTQLSTAVRNDPAILEAARTLPREKFEEKLEREQPNQHIEVHSPMKFHFGRSQRKAIEAWVEYAMSHNLAGTREEAVAWACEEAIDNALIDERLDSMPANEVIA